MMKDHWSVSFSTAEEVIALCEAYFDSLPRYQYLEVYDPDLEEKVWKNVQVGHSTPGLAGLAYALGVHRNTIFNWLKRADDEDEEVRAIVHVLTRAKARIEAMQEAALFDRETNKGAQFSLTVNYGWRENAGEGGEGSGGAFIQNILPPAPADQRVAIPKWGDDDEE